MNRYGQTITWSTLTAPHPFSGVLEDYSYDDRFTRQNEEDESGEFMAAIIHSRKAELSFKAKVTSASTDWLDLSSSNAALTVSGVSGIVLCKRAEERWELLQTKRISVDATCYPDMVQSEPVGPGAISAFDPAVTTPPLVFPGATIIYSTIGLTNAAGIIHGVTLTQMLEIVEDDPDPTGKLLGAATTGYQRTMEVDILATGAAPANGTAFTVTGAPSRAANFSLEGVRTAYRIKGGMMYRASAFWIPPMTT
jgi:hypothetical protein